MRALALIVLSAVACHADDSWTQFRGSRGDGVAATQQAPTTWKDTNVRWKTPIPGNGWSSPVFADGVIWMTTAEIESLTEEEVERIRAEEYADHMLRDQLVIVGAGTFSVIGVDANTGAVLHQLELISDDRPAPIHPLNSYASPTPVLDNGRLYCHFGSFGTVCIDTQTQQEIWRTQFPSVESVGPGSSPLLVDGKLILPFDGTDDQFVVALDADTGEPVWRTERPAMEGNEKEYHKAFSTPVLIEHEGRRQVVIVGAQWVCSYDPETGEELWRLRHGKGFSMSPRPVYGNGLIYICTAYAGIGVAAIDPSGNGDVTGSHLRWSHESQAPNMSSPILVGEEIFFVSDRGIATCLNALDGERLWRERLGGNFCASPILVGEHLYFANREGKVHVIKARPDYEPVVVNDLSEAVMASPAVIGDDLLIRTDGHLYRIGS